MDSVVFLFIIVLGLLILIVYLLDKYRSELQNSYYWYREISMYSVFVTLMIPCYFLFERYINQFRLEMYVLIKESYPQISRLLSNESLTILVVIILILSILFIRSILKLKRRLEFKYVSDEVKKLINGEMLYARIEYKTYKNASELQCISYIYFYERVIKDIESKLHFYKLLLQISGAIVVSSDILEIIKLDNSILIGAGISLILLCKIYASYKKLEELRWRLDEYRYALDLIKYGIKS